MKNLLNFIKKPNADQRACFNHNAAIKGVPERERRNSVQPTISFRGVLGWRQDLGFTQVQIEGFK